MLCIAKPFTADWESINSRPIPKWFQDAKFGIFIHWGVYSVPAWAPVDADVGIYGKYSEWYWWRIMNPYDKVGKLFREHHNKVYGPEFKYQDFAPEFTAEHFNATQWAELFKNAGAKYVVLTAKHHDGFTLWPSSKSKGWNSMDIGPKRDLCGELAKAVRESGLRMGFYYSLYEWFNPVYHLDVDKYVEQHMIPQMKDLVNSYHPDILWVDGEWYHYSEVWKSVEFLQWLYNESPVRDFVVVNDRWGKETRGAKGGFFTTEYGIGRSDKDISQFMHPWEECRGIGTSFGYNRMETADHYSSAEELVHMLIKIVANGGNLLLNVGPTADGFIPAVQQQRLLEIGKWLRVNGEAIYGTRRWNGAQLNTHLENTFFTQKDNDLFVIVTKFPQAPFTVKGLQNFEKISLIGYDGMVNSHYYNGRLTIVPPLISPIEDQFKHAWVFQIGNIFGKN